MVYSLRCFSCKLQILELINKLLFFILMISYSLSQLLYETCLCVWLLSYYEPAIKYLATSRSLPRLVDVVKSSTKEKVRWIHINNDYRSQSCIYQLS
jgi:hypothetical protein